MSQSSHKHHFRFAKVFIPEIAFAEPERFILKLSQYGPEYLNRIWQIAGAELPKEGQLPTDGLSIEILQNNTYQLALITLPEPSFPNECFFIAAIAPNDQPAELRLFNLEKAADHPNFQFSTILVEKTETKRFLYNENIEATRAEFLQWIQRTVELCTDPLVTVSSPARTSSTPVPNEAPNPDKAQSEILPNINSTQALSDPLFHISPDSADISDTMSLGSVYSKFDYFKSQWVEYHVIAGLLIGVIGPLLTFLFFDLLYPLLPEVAQFVGSKLLLILEAAVMGLILGFIQWLLLLTRVTYLMAHAWALITGMIFTVALVLLVDLRIAYALSLIHI